MNNSTLSQNGDEGEAVEPHTVQKKVSAHALNWAMGFHPADPQMGFCENNEAALAMINLTRNPSDEEESKTTTTKKSSKKKDTLIYQRHSKSLGLLAIK